MKNSKVPTRLIYFLLALLQTGLVVYFAVPVARQVEKKMYKADIIATTLHQSQLPAKILLASTQNATLGANSSLKISSDLGGNPITGITLLISFPATKVAVESLTFEDSLCSTFTQQKIDNIIGQISIQCKTSSSLGRTQITPIATAVFKPLQPGWATFSVNPTSTKLIHSSGINIMDQSESVSILVNNPNNSDLKFLADVPVRISCINEQELLASWLEEEGVEKFTYEFNESPTEMKNPTFITENSVTLPITEGKTYYFHIKSVRGSIESQQKSIVAPTC